MAKSSNGYTYFTFRTVKVHEYFLSKRFSEKYKHTELALNFV